MMRCRCIKSDPMEWIEVGKTYDIRKVYNVYMVEGMGFAVSPESFKEMFEPVVYCRTCAHRERWQCGGRVIQYCGVRKSKRTYNGLLKIKVTNPACELYLQKEL